MEIIKYEKVKNGNYNVFLDSGEVIILNENVITENELLFKKKIDNTLYKKLIDDEKICELYNMAIKYISIRLRSKKEIKDYLYKKEPNIDIIEKVCDRLEKNNYLDEERFTKAFINDKLKFTSSGDYKIRKELERLEIDNNIIEEEIDGIDKTLLIEKMKKVIEKDIKTNKKYSGDVLKNKIYNHLLSQGYSQNKVISIINEYNF